MLAAMISVSAELAPWLLLGALVSGVMHAFLPSQFIATQLRGVAGVFKAVVFGVPLPLCSCGVIPAGVGLKKDGASDGSSLGFLISTPQTGVDSVLVSAGMLGWPFALFKVAAAAVLGIAGGLLVHALGDSDSDSLGSSLGEAERPGWGEGFWHAVQVLKTIWVWVVVGVVASAAITVYIPASELSALSQRSPFAVYGGVLLLSIPLYVCATASVPIAAALVAGGLPAGSALVFLIAGPATNVATIGAVARTFGRRVLAVYLATLIIGSIVLGISFDHLLPPVEAIAGHVHEEMGWLSMVSSIVLVLVFVAFAVEDLRAKLRRETSAMNKGWNVSVQGMTCGGCSSRLERVLNASDEINSAQVDLEGAQARIDGVISSESLAQLIASAGFEPGQPEAIQNS